MAIGVDPSFGDAGIAKADTGVNGFHGTVMIRELTDGASPAWPASSAVHNVVENVAGPHIGSLVTAATR